MEALKKKMIVNHDGFIKVPIPPNFGRQVEIIVLPATYEQNHDESEYFECVAEDGTTYRVNNWTDAEFNRASMMSAYEDDDTAAEELFDV